ncbi:hypothetical protein A3Q56_04170 [Intoshia linei]|uniref:Uncharacterized protein n=1 Tax=Intoshia linei TaxID=1819745 RepID=A0A177B3V8_9BILA|nr:hypothetical protein A3Q56_04170 [Intoshia linei]
MLGSSFFSIVHKDDHSLLKHQITDEKNVPLARGDRREFFLRILDSKNKQYPWYQFCHVNGFVRKIPLNSNGNFRNISINIKSEENDKCENCYIFILRGLINLTTSMIYTPFMESSRCQWYCRHSVDGRILQTDSKINWISGFMSNEVLNSSPYFFLHHLDIDFLIGIHNTFLITGCAPKFVTRFYDKSLKILYVLTELKYIDAGQSYQIISMNQLLSVNEGTYMWEKQQRCINRYNSSKINNNSKFVKNSVFLRDNILTVITNQREYQMKVHGHCPYIKLKYTEPTFLTSDCTSNILPSSVPMKSELKFSTRKNYQLPFTSDYKEKENKDFENKWAKYYTSKHLLTLKNIQKKLVTHLVETSNVYPSNCNFLSNICTQSDNNKSICNLLFRQIDKNIEKPLVDSRIQCSKSVSNKQ